MTFGRSVLAAVGMTIPLSIEACAFEAASSSAEKVTLTDRSGVREFLLSSFAGGTGFARFRLSPDKQYAGWEVEEAGVPQATPIPLTLVIAGPTTELRIAGDQVIRQWSFGAQAVRVCFGPTHGPQELTCRTYRLPE